MPKCKNDSARSYKGTEPSPKGLGYCAHAEKLGTKMKGRDGKMWVIVKTKANVRKWSILKTDNELDILLKKKSIVGKDIEKLYKLINKDTISLIYRRILRTGKKRKKTFTISSNQVIISDPSYEMSKSSKGFLGQEIYKTISGKWEGYYHEWIDNNRPNILVVSHTKYKYPSKNLTYEYGDSLAVDAGMIAIMDKDAYWQGKTFSDEKYNKWYNAMVNMTIDNVAGNIKGGYVCNSGWGDGRYDYMVGYKKSTKIAVQFIVFFIP